ncbi:hypothetical protein [Pseudazoarcus pumilus]|uniref:hypothetical protein n=1 Tax=Pseudazoarcus pumilus TaxID=2067960 RepID=UPI000F516559|nr:hypothetical protein [Pseudazoarcus pumilus]
MYGLAFIGYHFLVFSILLLIGVRGTKYLSREIQTSSRRRVAIAFLWLAVLAVPFWDYIPGKIYFNKLCQDAGAEILAPGYSSTSDLEHVVTRTPMHFGIEKTEVVYFDPDSKNAIARKRWYRKGGSGSPYNFFKPWIGDHCPRSQDGSLKHAHQVAGKLLYEKFKEQK